MGLYPEQYGLPDDAEIKDINAYKKKINWGEIPAFFQLVGKAIADAEGFIHYGFDNAFKKLVDRKNWNYDLLGIADTADRTLPEHAIEPIRPPKICLYHVFNKNGYELLAFPYVNNLLVDDYREGDPQLEFKRWDPSQMKKLVRIPELHKFIAFTLNKGDDADMALIIHAHNVVNRMISMLQQELIVNEIRGLSIDQAFKRQERHPELKPEEAILSGQLQKNG